MVSRALAKKVENLSANMEGLEWLSAITRVHYRIGTIQELEKISRIYLRELIDMTSCDACSILSIELDKIRILAERGFTKIIGERKLSTDLPVIEHLIETKKAVFTGDPINSHMDKYTPDGLIIGSLFCVPLLVNDGVKGILYLDSMQKNAFDEGDVQFSTLMAAEISVAIEQSYEYTYFRNIFTRDAMTGCLNRSKFDVDIVAEVTAAQEYEEQLSLLVVDVDWLGIYNQFHGQGKGDRLLEKVADTLTSNIRSYERVYRYGGGEFAILMRDTGRDKALSSARRLKETIEQTQFEGEKESQPGGNLTVSIGVATFPFDGYQCDEVIETASAALRRAKESGRNQACIFNN